MSKTLKVHITGETTIMRNDRYGYPIYSTKISNMNKDGIWEYDYIQVQLPSGHEVPNMTEIKINDGFLTFFNRKNGTKEKCIRITSYDIMNQTAGEIDIPIDIKSSEDLDLPF